MIVKVLSFLQKIVFLNPSTKKLLNKIGIYHLLKNFYRRIIIMIGKNGLSLNIDNVSAKIIVSNPSELNFYLALDAEKSFLQAFLKKIKSNTVFYDVGAHIGLYSLCAGRNKIKPKFIYCWEPELFNFKRLNENININNIKTIKTFQKALGMEDCLMKMFTKAKEPGCATSNFSKKSSNGTMVEMKKGDNVVFDEGIMPPSIVKIDVEGYEFNVIKGLEKTIKKYHPIIFLEIHPFLLKNLGINKEDVFNFFKRIDYKINFFSQRRGQEHYILQF